MQVLFYFFPTVLGISTLRQVSLLRNCYPSSVSLAITLTCCNVSSISAVAKRKSLFDDKAVEIEELTYIIKQVSR